jgi:hypothetical protein
VGKTSKILKGVFPAEPLTLDQQVKIVNAAGDKLAKRVNEGKPIDERANNLFLWLGGLNKDIQLYACQYIFNVKKLEIDADEKTEARLTFMEPHFEYGGAGYTADTFQAIDHRPWPVEHLDGTTFEDRLEVLFKEQLRENPPEIVSADMILNGIGHDIEISINDVHAQITLCTYVLSERKDDNKAAKTSVAYVGFHEQVDNYLGWLLRQEPEMAIIGLRLLIAIFRIEFDHKLTKNWDEVSERYGDLIKGIPAL